MPSNLLEALRNLIGHSVSITTDGGTFTGMIASVTEQLVTLAHGSNGVAYIRVADINGVISP